MEHNWKRLTDWAIHKIETEYKEDIALLIAVKGHAVNGDGHGECFDYFIPSSERGYELAQTFIIDGVGHDLYGRSWERTEKTAELEDITLCLAGAEILYARRQEDADRFRGLQEQLKKNLQNPVFVYRKALERLDDAMDVYRTMIFEEKPYLVRMAAGFIHLYLTQAAAFINGTFADSPIFTEQQAKMGNVSDRMYHCPELAEVPEHLEKLKDCSILLEEKVRKHIISHGVKIREYPSLDNFLEADA